MRVEGETGVGGRGGGRGEREKEGGWRVGGGETERGEE